MRCDEESSEFWLSGYMKVAEHGFALPCYRRHLHGNAWYTATCSVPGDRSGRIVAFEPLMPEHLIEIAPGMRRVVRVGDAWQDVFLWTDSIYIGTPAELWESIASVRDDVAKAAPLSLLDMAECISEELRDSLARACFDYMVCRFGQTKAVRWRDDTYLRNAVVVSLRRLLGSRIDRNPERRAMQDVAVTERADGQLHVSIPDILLKLLDGYDGLREIADDIRARANTFSLDLQTLDLQPSGPERSDSFGGQDAADRRSDAEGAGEGFKEAAVPDSMRDLTASGERGGTDDGHPDPADDLRNETYGEETAEGREIVDRARAFLEDALAKVDPVVRRGLWDRANAAALFMAKLCVGTAAVATALLHLPVEAELSPLDHVEEQFGKEIGRLVDGVAKLSRLEMPSGSAERAESFRKLILAMSEDIRVLLIRLADRLHVMRTLRLVESPDQRKRIARETLDVYAPLAERLGMRSVKEELEDFAFAELNPVARDSILAHLARLRPAGVDRIESILKELAEVLHEEGLEDVRVSGYEMTPYAIWRSVLDGNVSLEKFSDTMVFHAIVDSVGECYRVLGIIHSRYPVVPGSLHDYISTPQANGYRGLHTRVIGPKRVRIDVQIRTKDMHEVSELGVAAHWVRQRSVEGEYRWLRELLDILEHATKPEEFLEHTKLELFQDQVFCFTPKGDLIALPRGATPVDFAYAVHSEVGDHCVGAKINGRMLPLRTQLQNGDQVDIITSKAQTPVPGWERFVVTGKARARIRKFLRTQQRAQYIELGRAILQRQFRQEGYDYGEKALDGVLKIFQQPSVDDLLASVGSGLHSGREVFHAVFPGHKPHAQALPKDGDDKALGLIAKPKPKPKGKEAPLPIRGLIPGMAVHYARCCHPLPGDRIVGIVTTGKGVTIHTIDCETLESFNDSPERWIDVAWDVGDSPEEHVGRINLVVANEPGSLGTLSTVIGKNGGNITNLKITSRNTDFFELLIDIDVKDAKHLTNIMAALRATPVINSVDRARGR